MFYTLPPSPPAIVHVEAAPASGDERIASECKRGDRHCFPQDRVGYQPGETGMVTLVSAFTTPQQNS